MQIKFQKSETKFRNQIKIWKKQNKYFVKARQHSETKEKFRKKAKREKASNKFCKIYTTKNVYTKISIKFTKIMVL